MPHLLGTGDWRAQRQRETGGGCVCAQENPGQATGQYSRNGTSGRHAHASAVEYCKPNRIDCGARGWDAYQHAYVIVSRFMLHKLAFLFYDAVLAALAVGGMTG